MAYWLWACREDFIGQATGTTFKEITKSKLRPIVFPLAPLPEQHRIVTKIEELFTRLDAGVAALKRAQANLKRYKAAVLKAACEGKLVEQDPSDEPASELLARILAERRAKWEADVRAKGKDPKKAKYEEPKSPDIDELPELPQGWCWASVEQVCERIVDCLHSTAKFQEAGFLCVDSNCIKPGQIVLERVRYVDEPTFIERNRRMKPQEDDVIFSREGALLGIAVRVPHGLEFCLGQRMMIFRMSECIDSKFFENVVNSLVLRSQYASKITGTASPHLNIEDTRVLAIPLPPLTEQRRIVAEAERRLSVAQELEATLAANLARSERLRQSILKRAFEGKLVAQVAGEESAGELLERIRDGRGAVAAPNHAAPNHAAPNHAAPNHAAPNHAAPNDVTPTHIPPKRKRR